MYLRVSRNVAVPINEKKNEMFINNNDIIGSKHTDRLDLE